MSEVIFKDSIELSAIFPDLSHISDLTQFMNDNSSLSFTIKDEFVDEPWDLSTNDIMMVVGVNQQSGKRYIETYVRGGTTEYGSNWEEGYYKIFVRKYKRPTNGESYVNLLDSNDFFELTKKELFWNRSILSFMVYIQPGNFIMGSPLSEFGRQPDEVQHKVTLTQGFYVGRTVLTNALFDAVMTGIKPVSDLTSIEVGGQTKSTCFSLSSDYWTWYKEDNKGDNFGRVYISYNKYQSDKSSRDGEYSGFGLCTINGQTTYYPYPYLKNENLPSGETDNSFITKINSVLPVENYTWDIPTEAQWEYTCRSGKKSAFNNGENLKARNIDESETVYAAEPQINEICWYKMHDGQRHACALLKCSPWGLYDTHGNNWEWTKDFDNENIFSSNPVTDPYESIYIPSSEGPYGDYSDAKVIRGGWAGWTSKACRAAYRYEDFVSAVAPSFGARLILRKGSFDVTISPNDVDACPSTTVTSADCSYTISSKLLPTDVVNVTYSIDNTNNTIAISNASVTYTGTEEYTYNVIIGNNAKINRLYQYQYNPNITPEFIGDTSTITLDNPPTQTDFSYKIDGIASGDTITDITSSIALNSDESGYTVNVIAYNINQSADNPECRIYDTPDLTEITVPINNPVIDIVVTPNDIYGICGTYTQVTSDDCSYNIAEGYVVDQDNDIISVTYSIDNINNTYYISDVSITKGGSGDYSYNIISSGTASINKIPREQTPVTITPKIELKYSSWPLNPADSPGSIAEKLIITPVASNLYDGDYVNPDNYECTITNDGTIITIQTEHYDIIKQSNYNGGCYAYTPITLGSTTYAFSSSITYNVEFTPILENSVCINAIVTADEVSYIQSGIVVAGDIVNLTYEVDNANDTLTITSATITKSNPGDESYSYNITTNSGVINRKPIDQITIDLQPVYTFNESNNYIIDTSDSIEDVITNLINNNNLSLYKSDNFNNNDSITNVIYTGSKDNNIMDIYLHSYNINYEEGSCRNYSVGEGHLTIYPLFVTGSLEVCNDEEITNPNVEHTQFGNYLQSGDTVTGITYTYDSTNDTITPNFDNVSITKNGNGNYWYSFTAVENNVTRTDKKQFVISVTPTCTVKSGETLYTTDSQEDIISKLNFNCIINGTIKSGDTVTVNNKTSSTIYNVNIDKNNRIVNISMMSTFTISQTIDPDNASECYEYVATPGSNQTLELVIPIYLKLIAEDITYISGTTPTEFPYTVQLKYNDESEYTQIATNLINNSYTIFNVNNIVNGDIINIQSIGLDGNNIKISGVTVTKVGDNKPIRNYIIETVDGTATAESSTDKVLTITATTDDVCRYNSVDTLEEEIEKAVNTAKENISYTVDGQPASKDLVASIEYNDTIIIEENN